MIAGYQVRRDFKCPSLTTFNYYLYCVVRIQLLTHTPEIAYIHASFNLRDGDFA